MSHIPLLTTAVLSSLSALVYSAMRNKPKVPASAYPKSVEAMAAAASNLAVARARSRWAIQLDYSAKSIQVVEMILAQLHEAHKTEPALVDVNSMAFIFGAYIGETIRRNHRACFWQRDFDCYPLHYGETTCFPMAWCTTRIAVGSAENVWVKYQMLTQPQPAAAMHVYEMPKARSASAGAY
jgi:hypothetical protein